MHIIDAFDLSVFHAEPTHFFIFLWTISKACHWPICGYERQMATVSTEPPWLSSPETCSFPTHIFCTLTWTTTNHHSSPMCPCKREWATQDSTITLQDTTRSLLEEPFQTWPSWRIWVSNSFLARCRTLSMSLGCFTCRCCSLSKKVTSFRWLWLDDWICVHMYAWICYESNKLRISFHYRSHYDLQLIVSPSPALADVTAMGHGLYTHTSALSTNHLDLARMSNHIFGG